MAKKTGVTPTEKKTNIKPRAQMVKPVEAEEEKVSETTEETGATADTDKSGNEVNDLGLTKSAMENLEALAKEHDETERLLEGANGERLRESLKQLDEGGGTERELLDGANELGFIMDEANFMPPPEPQEPFKVQPKLLPGDENALVVKRRPRRQ